MATPGHPFLDETFDELRAAQRRQLAWIPAWILDRSTKNRAPLSLPDDVRSEPAEVALRQYITKVRKEDSELDDYLNATADEEKRYQLARLLITREYDDPHMRHHVDAVSMNLTPGTIPTALTPRLYGYIALLLLADDLAATSDEP